jgi:protein-L-isoaspartate(D-aspartate) O-methyltransferase
MTPVTADFDPDPFLPQRLAMVALQLRHRGIRNERVLAAMERVPRHLFVPPGLQSSAYDDSPVPIGAGQTISQPFIVAYMLQELGIASESRVLEVGTGTGYEAALLAELAREVYTIERVPSLFVAARANLSRLGYANIEVAQGDGTRGLPEHAPFDRIIVAAAAPDVPAPLFEQLAEGGRMILPVGSAEVQDLLLIRKQDGNPVTLQLEGCRFVPLLGEQGFHPR